MPDYAPHEIIDMILILGECRGNYRAAARLWAIFRSAAFDAHDAILSQLFSACAARI